MGFPSLWERGNDAFSMGFNYAYDANAISNPLDPEAHRLTTLGELCACSAGLLRPGRQWICRDIRHVVHHLVGTP
jgi:hypothetical protein